MKNLNRPLLALTLFLGSCASTLDSGAMRRRLDEDGLRLRPAELEEALDLQSRLQAPVRLAIAPPWIVESGTWSGGTGLGTWTVSEREVLERWVETARTNGLVSEAEFIPSVLVGTASGDEGQDLLRSLRAAAALQHCDALLVVQRTTDLSRWEDEWSALYLTIVGMFFVPATHVEAMAIIEGFVLEVESGALWRAADGTGERERTTNFVRADREQRRLPDKAALEALDAFCAGLSAGGVTPGSPGAK